MKAEKKRLKRDLGPVRLDVLSLRPSQSFRLASEFVQQFRLPGRRTFVFARTDDYDGLGARRWDPPIRRVADDFDKLRHRTYTVDRAATHADVERLGRVFDGILPADLQPDLSSLRFQDVQFSMTPGGIRLDGVAARPVGRGGAGADDGPG